MIHVPLSVNTVGQEEIDAVVRVMKSGRMTQGPEVEAFEQEFAEYVGAPYAVFCNSGSSANLLMMSMLKHDHDAQVITPALTWPTVVYPIHQRGFMPVFVDVDPQTLSPSVNDIRNAISRQTIAVLIPHLLGNPAEIEGIQALCAERGIDLLEDCCEALEVTRGGRHVGTFGRMASFSFYFSHHITTIEGGMVICSSLADALQLRRLRDHGIVRDGSFRCLTEGYNLRGMEITAAIGRVQLRKGTGKARRRMIESIFRCALGHHPEIFLPVSFDRGANPFAFPVVMCKTEHRALLREWLTENGIETRMLLAGNIVRQPVLEGIDYRVHGALTGADHLHDGALYVGIHPSFTGEQTEHFRRAIGRFVLRVAA